MKLNFTWDNTKAAKNLEKHRVSFEEAQTVFDNPLAVILPDPAHSSEELREIIIGHSVNDRLLLISFTERQDSIRIISARRATTKEQRDYESGTNFF
ncbi:MAG TPA: BrnT family toxin [Roseiflexaceae bacterium]|nr:BrnT family toxin [Roseiflexaceae bacterium]